MGHQASLIYQNSRLAPRQKEQEYSGNLSDIATCSSAAEGMFWKAEKPVADLFAYLREVVLRLVVERQPEIDQHRLRDLTVA
ncbi:hypothetical protein AU186_10255 [Mycobacterium sp. GA-1999]|nr:hypothetical protein AU185_21115 [Mycobacterium sp. GA-0227b]KUH90055.1 hypothetical protein AU186_10255 [Mycobacterium sp. GA-1999]